MARNSEDLKLLWSVLHGSAVIPRRGVRGARVAIWDEEPGFPLAREVRESVERAGKALEAAGAVVEHAKPAIDGSDLMDMYTALLVAVISVDLPDAMFEGFEALRERDKKSFATEGERASAAAYRLRATASYRDVMRAAVRRQAMKDRLAEFFDSGWEAVLMPVSPVTAFRHQQEPAFNERTLEVDGATVPYPTMLNWIAPATALHAPALAVPAGRAPSGLPVGVQLMGRWRSEDRLFDFAQIVEEATGGFQPPPLN
jgi:amidase